VAPFPQETGTVRGEKLENLRVLILQSNYLPANFLWDKKRRGRVRVVFRLMVFLQAYSFLL
jgi:hypothetical protein